MLLERIEPGSEQEKPRSVLDVVRSAYGLYDAAGIDCMTVLCIDCAEWNCAVSHGYSMYRYHAIEEISCDCCGYVVE